MQQEVESHGFSILPNLLDSAEIEFLLSALSVLEANDGIRQKGGVYTIRNLLKVVPAVFQLAQSHKLTNSARAIGSG